MSRAAWSGIAYALLLVGLLMGYRGAKRLYEPQFPPELDAGVRGSKLGVLLIACQRTSRGMELCRQSVLASPDSAMPHFQLAAICHKQGMPLEAIVEYREAIRCQPDWAQPRVNLGILLGQMGRLEEAIEEFSRAGDDPFARHNLEITRRALESRRGRGGR